MRPCPAPDASRAAAAAVNLIALRGKGDEVLLPIDAQIKGAQSQGAILRLRALGLRVIGLDQRRDGRGMGVLSTGGRGVRPDRGRRWGVSPGQRFFWSVVCLISLQRKQEGKFVGIMVGVGSRRPCIVTLRRA